MKHQSWAPSKYSTKFLASIFVSFKLKAQKVKLTLDFSDVRLILKLLYIKPVVILPCFVPYTVGKPTDKKGDVDCVSSVLVHVYRQMQ